MPTCNICKYAGRPTNKSPCSECKEFSKYEYENKKTNADIIRDMTDEELAELLANETYRIAKPCFDAFGYGLEKQVIYVKRLKWLQQPTE